MQKPVWTEEPGGLRAEEHVSGGVSSKSQGPEVQASQDQGVRSRMTGERRSLMRSRRMIKSRWPSQVMGGSLES